MNRLGAALILSAILNVFLLGIGLGVVATGSKIVPASAVKARPFPNIWEAAEGLPEPDRQRFRAMLRDQAAQARPLLKTVRSARQDAAALMAAPTFDGAAMGQDLARARANEAQARGAFDTAFLAYLSAMPQTQRATLAQGMMRSGPRVVRQAIRAQDQATDHPQPGPQPKIR